MRVTNNVLSRNLLLNLGSSAERLAQLQNQMSSAKKINKPSDDPVGVQNVMRYNNTLSAVELWKSNASEALSYMNTADSTIGQVSSMFQRARELAIQGADGNLSEEQQSTIAAEIKGIREQIRSCANFKLANRYIFAGTESGTMPLPNETITAWGTDWKGNDQDVLFQVGDNLKISISVDGGNLFENIFSSLDNLYNSLENSDLDGVNDALGDMDDAFDNLLKIQTDLGARTNRMNSVLTQLENTSINLESNISDIQDLDYAKAILDFQTEDNIYRAALAVGMQVIQPSLVDFMS